MNTIARIVTVCQGHHFENTVEKNVDYIRQILEVALKLKPDLVCLPETFSMGTVAYQRAEEVAEPVLGSTTDLFARYAKEHRCYVICPLFTRREGVCYNSAVVLDRSGGVLGIYDKIHPVTSSNDYTVFERGNMPGKEAPVFDLDFGRIGIQICFDIGFPESWDSLAQQEARLVFWPSAYNGGFPLQVYAALHNFYVVSSVLSDSSRIIDPCGTILARTDSNASIAWRDINLDYMVCHTDFNAGIPERVMNAYPGRVEIRSHPDDGRFLIEPTDPEITMSRLQSEFGIESFRQYHARHREAYACLLQREEALPQQAAHGSRAIYGKG
ncbi:MAG: carbon-nitrogen hydrolase family protein [Armatimonadetes bacterium]|nr:carbon-nitrogen hydrolase family protein [Armatimonadota bacterium]